MKQGYFRTSIQKGKYKYGKKPLKYLNTFCRYSANSFKLHRLPVPRPGVVLGLVGTNGIGKSTALKILSGKQKPNLGRVRY